MKKGFVYWGFLGAFCVSTLGVSSQVFAAIPKESQSSSGTVTLPSDPLLREFTLLSQKRDALFVSRGAHGHRLSALRERTLEIQREWRERFLRGEGPVSGGDVFSASKRKVASPRSFALSTQSGELYWVTPQKIIRKGQKPRRSWVFLSEAPCAGTASTQACTALKALRASSSLKLHCGNTDSVGTGSAFRELWVGTSLPEYRACQYSDRSLLVARAQMWMDLPTLSEK